MLNNTISIIFVFVLLYIGYNLILNTNVLVKKVVIYSRIQKNTEMYKKVTNPSNITWLKIAGIAVILFSIAVLIMTIFNIFKNSDYR